MDAQLRQQPAADEGADNPEAGIGDQAEARAAHDLSGQPSRNQTNKQNDENAFTRHDFLPLRRQLPMIGRKRNSRAVSIPSEWETAPAYNVDALSLVLHRVGPKAFPILAAEVGDAPI